MIEYEDSIYKEIRDLKIEIVIGKTVCGILKPFKDYTKEQIDIWLDDCEEDYDPADYWKKELDNE